MNKQKLIHRYREQMNGYQSGRGCEVGQMGEEGQWYGDGWELDFWEKSLCNVYTHVEL